MPTGPARSSAAARERERSADGGGDARPRWRGLQPRGRLHDPMDDGSDGAACHRGRASRLHPDSGGRQARLP